MEVEENNDSGIYSVLKSKTFVFCEDAEFVHPHCPHGPMLKFLSTQRLACGKNENRVIETKKHFYACAAYRDKKKCSFHLLAPVSEVDLERRFTPEFDWEKRDQFLECKKQNVNVFYCLTCDKLFFNEELDLHGSNCEKKPLTMEELNDPTLVLRSQNCNKAEAQYFFDIMALELFVAWFKNLKINKIVCIGAPRLHAYIMKITAENPKLKMQSFLLDLDSRYNNFFEDNQFAWYNMCNTHFFNDKQKEEFEQFLKCTNKERLLFFTDPPYGCRTEPIAFSLQLLTQNFNKINKRVHQPAPIFWIFPYFAENYIKQQMPEFEMFDYKINYTNHSSYTNVGTSSRKFGSAARLFTNVPLKYLPIKSDNNYKYCETCCRFTAKENLHCNKCGACTSKNGTTYTHCELCDMCVKPMYVHCTDCRRCTQREGHNCEEYQRNQVCRICLQLGHVERLCYFIKGPNSKKVRAKINSHKNCFICGRKKHNERICPKRSQYLVEDDFMGVRTVKRKKIKSVRNKKGRKGQTLDLY